MFIEILLILILLSGLILFLVLSYRKKDNYIQPKNPKIAIVSMVTKQPDFDFWLKYHIDYLDIDSIFLRVEDSPEYKFLVDKYRDRVKATFYDKKDIDTKHNYQTIMDRQKKNVNKAIKEYKKLGYDYIFHIDADELIYVKAEKGKTKKQSLQLYLNSVPLKYSCIHLKNFEGIFKDNNKACFNTNRFIDCQKGSCLSYANGKSIGKLRDNISFRGPHYFSGKVYEMSDDKIAVLHFDSCTYEQWINKFDRLKNTNEQKMNEIPFGFYKNSIKNLQVCGGSKKYEVYCDFKLKNYYNSQKVNPQKSYKIIEYI